jgi:putative membrane protein
MPEYQKNKRGLVRPLARSRTLSRVAVMAVAFGVYGSVPEWPWCSEFRSSANIPAEIHAALTLVLGWLLVFRTNTAYGRWWEARTIWGEIVSVSRTLAAKYAHMVNLPEEELDSAGRYLVAFSWGLRDHLRDAATSESLTKLEGYDETVKHVPVFLVDRLYKCLFHWKSNGWIDGADQRVIDADLHKLHELAGKCESIRLTRIASSYRVFVRQCIAVCLLSLPWGITADFGWWTAPLTALTAYFMLGLEVVAEHVEEPFGDDEDDLDLDRLCTAVTDSVQETIARAKKVPKTVD